MTVLKAKGFELQLEVTVKGEATAYVVSPDGTKGIIGNWIKNRRRCTGFLSGPDNRSKYKTYSNPYEWKQALSGVFYKWFEACKKGIKV